MQHTTIFNIFEYGDGPAQLRVEEIDSNGYIRKKTLETYFFGIIGHLRDSRGESMNTWELSQQLANYWGEWLGLPTQGAVFPAYEPTNQAQDQASASTWTPTREATATGGFYMLLWRNRSRPPSCSWHGFSTA